MSQTFFDRLKILDEIIKAGPNIDNLVNIDSLLLENASREYFYNNLNDDIEWVKILDKLGEFINVPGPVKDGKNIGFLGWPESKYLIRMTPKAPQIILDIILKIDTENIRVYADFIDAALLMPPQLAIKIIPKAKLWIESQYQLLFPEKIGQLAAYLAEENQIKDSLDLISKLLELIPEKGDSNDYLGVRAHFDVWDYEKILKDDIPIVIKYGKEEALNLLCDLLDNSIKITKIIKRDTIEGYDALYRHDIKNHLITAIRDAADILIKANEKEILKIIETRKNDIFTRIGLYLRYKWHEIDLDGTIKLIANPLIFQNRSLVHEYNLLLQKCFISLPVNTQKEYFTMIKEGIGLDPRIKADEGSFNYWQYRRLWPIRSFLNEEWKMKFDEINPKYNGNDPYLNSHGESTWIGPTSPKTIEELQGMGIDELISYLSNWIPQKELRAPSAEGLSRLLSSVIESKPEIFVDNIQKFKVLNPTYIRALIEGLRNVVKNGKTIPWFPVLNLCQWIIEQPREFEGRKVLHFESDPDWGWTRKSIADLIENGLNGDNVEIPISFRRNVWEILFPLTCDPDPDYEKEEKSNMDPVTMSINSIRGQAMHAVISYALWIRRTFEKSSQSQAFIKRGFEEMPEVKVVLENHLDLKQDHSLGVRAVYGQYFPWLVLLDEQWTVQNKLKIFPRDQKLLNFRDAAWGTYIAFCEPYDNVVKLIKDDYLFEIKRLKDFPKKEFGFNNYFERLAGHFIAIYWRGKLNLNEILYFFKKSSDETCAEAIRYAGENLSKLLPDDFSQENLNQLQILWEKRIELTQDDLQKHKREIVSYGWWFVSRKFDENWSVNQLKNVLNKIGYIEPDNMIVNIFENMVTKMPLDILDCLIMMVKGDTEGWRAGYWKERLEKIIYAIKGNSDNKIREKAKELLNILGSKGLLEFRNFIDYFN